MERPILFSTEMVRAILAGRKTQTRRVIKPQPNIFTWHGIECAKWKKEVDCTLESFPLVMELLSPYGAPGDLLYVRETMCAGDNHSGGLSYAYLSGGYLIPEKEWDRPSTKVIPSIHMPKQFARIWLEVKAVRVERLQEISEEDAMAEGVNAEFMTGNDPLWYYGSGKLLAKSAPMINGVAWTGYKGAFAMLWNIINAKRGYGWDTNPWVWVIEFERR